MAAGDGEPGPSPPPAETNAGAAEAFVPALKRASITSPFAAAECQDASVKPVAEKPPIVPILGRSGGGKAGRSGGNGPDDDAEAGRRSGRRRRRSPWLSAPMILGTEISTNIT